MSERRVDVAAIFVESVIFFVKMLVAWQNKEEPGASVPAMRSDHHVTPTSRRFRRSHSEVENGDPLPFRLVALTPAYPKSPRTLSLQVIMYMS